MKNSEFKIGDIVKLKTGGPEMIVFNVGRSPNPGLNCIYSDSNNIIHMQSLIDPVCLELIH